MTRHGVPRVQDWLIIGQEHWDEMERRNQLLVRALARRQPLARFLFAELPARPRSARNWRGPGLRRVAENIWATQAIRPFPDRIGGRKSDRYEAHQLVRALRRLGIGDYALWTQDPRVIDLLPFLRHGRFVYDLTDDWAAFETDPGRRAYVQANVEAAGRQADLVLACSRSLERTAQNWRPDVRFLPNAVDPPEPVQEMPPAIAGLPRPRIGYSGTLHESRIDVDLLAEAVRRRPQWCFVHIGPNELGPNARARLSRPNVAHLGVIPHAQVRSHLEALDVCLLPNLVNDFTRSLDPLKLYEYLAAGRPVITTPVGNAPQLQDLLVTARTAEEVVQLAERLLATENNERQLERRERMRAETWDARALEIEGWLGLQAQTQRIFDVSIVIVSHNTRDLLQRCLAAVARQSDVSVQTIVVDNASTDGSTEMIRRDYPWVELIESNENLGFGRANNLAFEQCQGEFVLLLNSDAFLEPDGVAQLIECARRHPKVGAVGPRLVNTDGSLQRSAWPFPSARRLLVEAIGLHLILRKIGLLTDLGTWRHDEERLVDFLVGACLLIRADALQEVQGFDEDFWLYAEEADLQRRMSLRGWPVLFTPATDVTHVAGASSTASLSRLRHFYSGQRLYLRKHGGIGAWQTARLALLVGSVIRGRWAAAGVALNSWGPTQDPS